MRLPLPGPHDVVNAMARGADSIEQLLGAVPRIIALVGDAERVMQRADELIERIEQTRAYADEMARRTDGVVTRADEMARRTDGVVTRADELLGTTGRLVGRLVPLLDRMEPSLVQLQPTLDRLAETTDPREVDALVALIDLLPGLAVQMETHVIPVMDSLASVAPDLHDLLDVSRELNDMLGRLPGLGRIKKRVDEEQAERMP